MSQSLGKNTYQIEFTDTQATIPVAADSFKIIEGFTIFFNGIDPELLRYEAAANSVTNGFFYEPVKLIPNHRISAITRQ